MMWSEMTLKNKAIAGCSAVTALMLAAAYFTYQSTEGAKLIVYILLAVTIAASILTAVLITRGVAEPLERIVEMTSLFADGNLNMDFEQDGAGVEITSLTRSLKRLNEGLRGLTASVERITQGDLGIAIKPRSEGDALGLALRDMVRSLYVVVSKVRAGSEQIKNISMNLANSGRQLE